MDKKGEVNEQKYGFLLSNDYCPRVPALSCLWPEEEEVLGPSSPVVSVRLLNTYLYMTLRWGGAGQRGIDRIQNNINYLFT